MSDFWARRKAAVDAESRAEVAALRETERAEAEAAQAARSDDDLLAEAGLPLPEDVASGEMVQKFLRSALPQRLKTRALRALWRSNPLLANLDGLVDYADDYTKIVPCAPGFGTTYEVGRGLLAHLEHLATAPERLAAAQADDAAAPEPEPEPLDPVRLPDTPGPTLAVAPAQYSEPDPAPETDPEDAALPPSFRRMQFRFEDQT